MGSDSIAAEDYYIFWSSISDGQNLESFRPCFPILPRHHTAAAECAD